MILPSWYWANLCLYLFLHAIDQPGFGRCHCFFAVLIAFLWSISRPGQERSMLWLDWGALSGGFSHVPDMWITSQGGSALRLFTALFLHAD